MTHDLARDISDSQIEQMESDGEDSVYVHFDNGVLLAFTAIVIDGAAKLCVTRVSNFTTRYVH